MGLYGRSDVVSVAVPVSAGGCGATHSRPVIDGAAADEWNLERDCVMCAATLRGDPLWAAMPADVPETPDEKAIREDAEKRGERAIKKAQEQLSVRQHELTEKIVQLLERNGGGGGVGGGTEVSASALAQIVQAEVAKALATNTEPRPLPEYFSSGENPAADETVKLSPVQLERLHVRTLGKMCRDRGLDGTGGKADLISRLTVNEAAEG